MTDAYVSTRPTWLIWVALVLAAPLFEETFFRGFVFKGLSSGPIRPLGALVVTAILWAIMHVQYDVYGIATVFLQGLLLGAARMTTQSLFVPIAMHAEANIVASVETAVLLA
jgi:membrane protease YdiL (CAAX protease family)